MKDDKGKGSLSPRRETGILPGWQHSQEHVRVYRAYSRLRALIESDRWQILSSPEARSEAERCLRDGLEKLHNEQFGKALDAFWSATEAMTEYLKRQQAYELDELRRLGFDKPPFV